MYGYEAELKPASDIFSRVDAEEALASAEEVFNACNRLIIKGKGLIWSSEHGDLDA
ncbi:MAG: hypothetical protein KAV25_08460 [Methanophagales archaeon]|nr:hypothetical protein [Methanophagales archaeon]